MARFKFSVQSTIQSIIQRELAINHGMSTNDRRAALHVARSLQSQLFFYEIEWGSRVLQDNVEDVFMFLDDQEGTSEAVMEREELPTGVITMLTRCYTPMCGEGGVCYSYGCPRMVCISGCDYRMVVNIDAPVEKLYYRPFAVVSRGTFYQGRVLECNG